MSKQIREFWITFKPYEKNPLGPCVNILKYVADSNHEHGLHVIDYESYQRLLDANKKLEKIIAKELSENDEFGAEFVHVNILKDENARLKKANKVLRDVLRMEHCPYCKDLYFEHYEFCILKKALAEAEKIEGGS